MDPKVQKNICKINHNKMKKKLSEIYISFSRDLLMKQMAVKQGFKFFPFFFAFYFFVLGSYLLGFMCIPSLCICLVLNFVCALFMGFFFLVLELYSYKKLIQIIKEFFSFFIWEIKESILKKFYVLGFLVIFFGGGCISKWVKSAFIFVLDLVKVSAIGNQGSVIVDETGLITYFTLSISGLAWMYLGYSSLFVLSKEKKKRTEIDGVVLVTLAYWFILSFFCGITYPIITWLVTIVGLLTPFYIQDLDLEGKKPKKSLEEHFVLYIETLSQNPGWLSIKGFWEHDFLKRKQEKLEYLVVEILWLLSICLFRALRTKYQPLERVIFIFMLFKALIQGILFGLLVYFGLIIILTILASSETLASHLKSMYGQECFRKLGWAENDQNAKDSIIICARICGGLCILGPTAAILDCASDYAGIIRSNMLLSRAENLIKSMEYLDVDPEQWGSLLTLTDARREWLEDYRNHTPLAILVRKVPMLGWLKTLGPVGELIRKKFNVYLEFGQ